MNLAIAKLFLFVNLFLPGAIPQGIVYSGTPVNPIWTVIQLATPNYACSNVSATCSITVASTGTGHLGLLIESWDGTTLSYSSASGGGTYTHCPNFYGNNAFNSNQIDCAYTLSTTSGATSISWTLSGANGNHSPVLEYLEASCTGGGTLSFDITNNVENGSSSTTQAAPSLSITGTNDLVVQGTSVPFADPTVLSLSYTANFSSSGGTFGAGFGYLQPVASYSAPNWTLSSSTRGANGAFAAKCQ